MCALEKTPACIRNLKNVACEVLCMLCAVCALCGIRSPQSDASCASLRAAPVSCNGFGALHFSAFCTSEADPAHNFWIDAPKKRNYTGPPSWKGSADLF